MTSTRYYIPSFGGVASLKRQHARSANRWSCAHTSLEVPPYVPPNLSSELQLTGMAHFCIIWQGIVAVLVTPYSDIKYNSLWLSSFKRPWMLLTKRRSVYLLNYLSPRPWLYKLHKISGNIIYFFFYNVNTKLNSDWLNCMSKEQLFAKKILHRIKCSVYI